MKSREYKYLRRTKIRLRTINFSKGELSVPRNSSMSNFLSNHVMCKHPIPDEAYDAPRLDNFMMDEFPLWGTTLKITHE